MSSLLKRDREENGHDDMYGKQQKPTTPRANTEEKQALAEAAKKADDLNNVEGNNEDESIAHKKGGNFVNPLQDNQIEVALLQPAYLNESMEGQLPLHDKLLDSLKQLFFPRNDDNRRTTRSACKQTDRDDAPIVANKHKYGLEIYVQTEAFDKACEEENPKYTRIPADTQKHRIRKDLTPWLEKHVGLAPLRELCDHINQEELIDGKPLYLIQLVHYGAEDNLNRGRHIDNVDNGGHIIVGITLGDKPLSECQQDEKRYRSISFDLHSECRFTKKLPPGSVYVMKGQCRYEFHHDAKKPPGSSHYVIMLRYGKAE